VNQRSGYVENAETQNPADQENDEQNGENTHRLTSVSQAGLARTPLSMSAGK
jgi:hypothetical protein